MEGVWAGGGMTWDLPDSSIASSSSMPCFYWCIFSSGNKILRMNLDWSDLKLVNHCGEKKKKRPQILLQNILFPEHLLSAVRPPPCHCPNPCEARFRHLFEGSRVGGHQFTWISPVGQTQWGGGQSENLGDPNTWVSPFSGHKHECVCRTWTQWEPPWPHYSSLKSWGAQMWVLDPARDTRNSEPEIDSRLPPLLNVPTIRDGLTPQAGRRQAHSQPLWPLPPPEGSKIWGGRGKSNLLSPAEKSFSLQLCADPEVLNWPWTMARTHLPQQVHDQEEAGHCLGFSPWWKSGLGDGTLKRNGCSSSSWDLSRSASALSSHGKRRSLQLRI